MWNKKVIWAVMGLSSLSAALHAESWSQKAILALPTHMQSAVASAMHTIPGLQTDAMELQIKLLVDDFMDIENQKPLAHYIDEVIKLIDAHPTFFETILFTHVLKEETPNKTDAMRKIRDGLEKNKHSKNIAFMRTMIFMPVRKWVRPEHLSGKGKSLPLEVQNVIDLDEIEEVINHRARLNKG